MQYGNPTIASPRDRAPIGAPHHGEFQPQIQQGEPERRLFQAGTDLLEVRRNHPRF